MCTLKLCPSILCFTKTKFIVQNSLFSKNSVNCHFFKILSKFSSPQHFYIFSRILHIITKTSLWTIAHFFFTISVALFFLTLFIFVFVYKTFNIFLRIFYIFTKYEFIHQKLFFSKISINLSFFIYRQNFHHLIKY